MQYQNIIADIFERRAEERIESIEEERALIADAKAGSEAATVALMYAYAPAMRSALRWFTRSAPTVPQATDLEEARARAVVGLLEAVQAFDPAVHTRLAAIATEHIASEVSSLAADAVGFTVPERTLRRFYGILRKADGNVYEAANLAPEYKMRRETFFAVLSAVRNVDSYDVEPTEEDHERGSGGLDSMVARPLWSGEYEDAEDRILAEVALESVDARSETVCRMAYGFTDYDPVPDAEIGRRLGMTRPTTQRVRVRALETMREALGVA